MLFLSGVDFEWIYIITKELSLVIILSKPNKDILETVGSDFCLIHRQVYPTAQLSAVWAWPILIATVTNVVFFFFFFFFSSEKKAQNSYMLHVSSVCQQTANFFVTSIGSIY
jgi:hypothetical protein